MHPRPENILASIVGGGALDAPQSQLTELGRIVEQRILSGNKVAGIHIDKYIIMPNHIHILLFVDEGKGCAISRPANHKIPQFVSTFKRLCYRDAGSCFFQRSYHDHVIRGEHDYQMIWQYIDTNPARWQEDCFYQA